MNHADRQRLSDILAEVATVPTMEVRRRHELIDEARAIVDGTPKIVINEHVPARTVLIGNFDEYIKSEPPNPKLDAFLTEPIHEYTEHTRTHAGQPPTPTPRPQPDPSRPGAHHRRPDPARAHSHQRPTPTP